MKGHLFIAVLFAGILTVQGQQLHTGRVIHSETRKPLSMATVALKRNDSIVQVNALGFFQIRADSGEVMEIASPGMQTGQIEVPSSASFTVALEPEVEDSTVYAVVEDMATFPGGFPAFYKFVGKNLRIPSLVFRSGMSGKVYVQFTINADGTIPPEEVKVIRPLHPAADAEVVRVIRLSPRWNPGQQRGVPVRQRMVLPVNID